MTDTPHGETLAPPRELVFEADARAVGPLLKLATVTVNGAGHMSIVCDEPPRVGGLGSAPTPLMYFSAALAF